jgi:hypothetical protein
MSVLAANMQDKVLKTDYCMMYVMSSPADASDALRMYISVLTKHFVH